MPHIMVFMLLQKEDKSVGEVSLDYLVIMEPLLDFLSVCFHNFMERQMLICTQTTAPGEQEMSLQRIHLNIHGHFFPPVELLTQIFVMGKEKRLFFVLKLLEIN